MASETHTEERGGEAPLFGPESALRRVVQESAGLLGGGRALLLQLAHPLVAAGVADHSRFREEPLHRLQSTLDMMLALCLGDRTTGRVVIRAFHGAHVPVQGRLAAAAGPFPAGTPYTAQDPALKLWVQATLIDTSLLTYERFVAPLTPGMRAAFYADATVFARRLGIPAAIIPPDLPAFRRYMAGMLASDVLTVTDTARELAWAVLDPPVALVPRTGIRLMRMLTPGLLPPRLRAAFGLEWGPARQALLDAASGGLRLAHPLLPPAIRLMPQAGGGRVVAWVLQAVRGGRA